MLKPNQQKDNKSYKYNIIDTFYKADTFTKGRAFKKFFSNFCQKVFDINYKMLKDKDLQYFPLGYNENNAYSSISHALHLLTPYVWSEMFINYKNRKNIKILNSADINSKDCDDRWRFVDFWFISKDKEFEVWLEVKRLSFNVGKNANLDFDQNTIKRIEDALYQIYNIKNSNKDNPCQNSKQANLKVAFFIMPLWCKKSQKPTNKSIKYIPNKIANLLNDFIDNRRNMGVLCAVFELDLEFEKENLIYEGEYTPYFMLNAIILE
ncbi:hypothetical protein [Campylobacter ureolyticus]|uniref:hypothetical protein n=1 Tax=Campylobacter ureolyticus TaxID=827 RepID=UPI0022B33697|nr:hypothetical protein [Campylobacter ureolyticus]MCZ6174534.1 hypothetical protein [Campylobacter ureolyticus]